MVAFRFLSALALLLLSCGAGATALLKSSDLTLRWNSGWTVRGYTPDSFAWSRIGTLGKGAPVFATAAIGPVDLTKKVIEFQCRINSLDALRGIELRFSDNDKFTSFFAITLPLYRAKSFNILQGGAWQRFAFGLGNAIKRGSPDPSKIRYVGIYLQDRGNGPLRFDISNITIRPSSHKAVLSYTFDDGYIDDLVAAKVMKPYGQTATAYIIPKAVGTRGYMTLPDIKELAGEGWEISAHDETPFTQLDPLALKAELRRIREFFINNGLQTGMRQIAYPNGDQNRSYVEPMVRSQYDTARVASGGMETFPPGDFAMLRTYNVLNTTTVAALRNQVEKAKANNQWLILMFHRLHDAAHPSDSPITYDIHKFRRVVKMVSTEGIEVQTIDKVYKAIVRPSSQGQTTQPNRR